MSPSDWGSLRRGCVSLRLGLPEAGLCVPSDWGSLRRSCVSLRLGLPEDLALYPLRSDLPEAVLPLKFRLVEARLFPLGWGFLRAGLCPPLRL